MSESVTDNQQAGRYELHVDGDLAGYLEYHVRNDVIALNHTVVLPEFSGAGHAANLVTVALDDSRARGLRVLPYCPYVARFIKRHPEYLELVPQDRRSEFELA